MSIFSIVDTRSALNSRSAHGNSYNRRTILQFRADLPEEEQKAAIALHRSQLRQQWTRDVQAEAKALDQGTLLSVLTEEDDLKARQQVGTELEAMDRRLRVRQQQAWAAASIVVEAHRHKKRRLQLKKQDEARRPQPVTAPCNVDIANPHHVKLLLCDIKLILIHQVGFLKSTTAAAEAAKAKSGGASPDLVQVVRNQLALMNFWFEDEDEA